MSHGAAACASKLTHIGRPLPALATDSATARRMACRAVGAREKCIIVLGKDNTPDRVSFFINSLWGRGAYFFEAINTVGHGVVLYCGRMKVSLVRLVTTLLLSGQMLPVGLPLLCGQVQRATPANCEQQMASHPHGLAVGATTHATPCANAAFCAITAPAVVALGGAVSVPARESHIVGFGVSTLAPADPQAPLPPPPQA